MCYPLHHAARDGDIRKVIRLLGEGISMNARDQHERTPLHRAALQRMETVRYLLEEGANVNLKDDQGLTPLHLARFWKNADAIELLKQAGAKQ